jgi:hypothetical protein
MPTVSLVALGSSGRYSAIEVERARKRLGKRAKKGFRGYP